MTELLNPEGLPPSSPENFLAQDIPTVSVDRALAHILGGLHLDMEGLVSFYNALPHENKPPLSELSIHFSASPSTIIQDGEKYTTNGEIAWDGTKSRKPNATPELPKTSTPTIVVYLGSEAIIHDIGGDFSNRYLAEQLSGNLTHELTHYAQGCPDKNYGKIKKIGYKALGFSVKTLHGLIVDARWLMGGTATLLASELFSDNSVPTSLKAAAGIGTLLHITGHNKRKRDLEVDFDSYEKRDREVDARNHEDNESGIVKLTGFIVNKTLLDNITVKDDHNIRAAISRVAARKKHRKLSLQAPVRHPTDMFTY